MFSRDSMVLWTLTTHAKVRRRYAHAMTDPALSQLRFVRLRTPRAAEQFLTELATRRAAAAVGRAYAQ
jgi:hypothetical protein